ncbi:MAG: FAD binding domain-containing protein [Spirochaetaceae bacterium]|nr:FAD binding domain-containing protein [Spirochaetaceae bacterium]
MDEKERTKDVYFGTSLDEVLYQLRNRSNLKICGGCTYLRELPPVSMIIRNIKEFNLIEKRERYIEIGSGVTLASIMELGEKHIPPVFYQALSSIATPLVRNIATLGGNICIEPLCGTLFAPLLAMDAKLEFRINSEILSLPMTQFSTFETGNLVPAGSVLTKVRVPLDDWELSVFRRIGPSWTLNENCASYAFLASIQKETLMNLRIAFCGAIRLRSRELENKLIGTKLPLSPREIQDMLEAAAEYFDQQVQSFFFVQQSTGGEKKLIHDDCSLLGEHLSSCRISSVDFSLLKARFLGLLQESLNHLA